MKMYVKTANEEKKINNVIGYIQGSSEPGMSEDSKAKCDVSKFPKCSNYWEPR